MTKRRFIAWVMALAMIFQMLPATTLSEEAAVEPAVVETGVVETAVVEEPMEEPVVEEPVAPVEEPVAEEAPVPEEEPAIEEPAAPIEELADEEPAEEPAVEEEKPFTGIGSNQEQGADYAEVSFNNADTKLVKIGEALGELPEAPKEAAWFANGEPVDEKTAVEGDMDLVLANAEPVEVSGAAGDVTVKISAPAGALPYGAELKVATVEDAEVRETFEELNPVAIKAADISFVDAEGKEVQPLLPVDVKLSANGLNNARVVKLAHIHEEEVKEIGTIDALAAKEEPAGPMRRLAAAPAAETDKSFSFDFSTDSFSVFAFVIVTEYIANDGTPYEITVTYGADANIPEGSTLSVTEYSRENNKEAYEEALKIFIANKLDNNEEVDMFYTGFTALDISIIGPDGFEIEPEASVQVNMKIKSLPGVEDLSKVEGLQIQHHVETEKGIVVENVAARNAAKNSSAIGLDFDQDSEATGKAVSAKDIDLEEYVFESFGPNTIDTAEFFEQLEAQQRELEFTTEVFSIYTINWSNITNSSTNLRFRGTNSTRAQVVVHYQNQDGLEIARPTSIGNNVDRTLSNGGTVDVNIANVLGLAISGYTYVGASYNSRPVTDIRATRTSSGYSYTNTVTFLNNGTTIGSTTNQNAGDIYLIYNGPASGSEVKVHYGYMNGGSFVEFPEGKPEYTPTYDNGNTYLIYDVDGYEFVNAHLNAADGTTITPHLYINNGVPGYYANYNSGSTIALSDGDEIYLVYKAKAKPAPGGEVKPSTDEETWPEGADTPQFTKNSRHAGNGTNIVSLDIKAA